jgi:hypothetical protein
MYASLSKKIIPLDLVFHVIFTMKLVFVFLLEKTYVFIILVSVNSMKKKNVCYTVNSDSQTSNLNLYI